MAKKLIYLLGILFIGISLVTWSMDLTGVVGGCAYCRVERTVIGVIGLIMFIPVIPYFTLYLTYVLGFFGAHVASQQIFLDIMNKTIGLESLLATCALFIIIAQVIFIHIYIRRQAHESE